jgi:hypothetical protein
MYQINVIPCNAGLGSKRQMPKSRSADDMEVVLGKAEELESAQKMPVEPVKIKITARDSSENHLNMIANRAKNVQRKNKKMKSRLFNNQVILISKLAPIPSLLKKQENSLIFTGFSLE